MGVAKNMVEVQPIFSVLVRNNGYCHPADGIFVTNINIVLSHAICPSFYVEVCLEIGSAYRLLRLRSAVPLDWAAVTKFKTTKIN
jgi:hypothetical protein